METNTDFVKDAVLEETQGVDEVSKLSRNENLDLSLDALKDTLADEMFEEAVEAVTPTTDTENSRIADGGNGESILSMENGEQNSNVVQEIQKFEEDIAHAVQDSDHSDAQPEFMINELHPLESQTHAQKIVLSENNGLPDERNAEEKEVEFKEIVDLTRNDEEIDNLSHGDEVQYGVSEYATSLRPLSPNDSKDLDTDTGQESTYEIFETPKFHELSGGDSDPRKSDMNGCINEMTVNQDGNEIKGGDIGSMKPDMPSSDTLKNDDTKIRDDNLSREQSEMTSYEVEDAIEVPPAESNGYLLHIHEQSAVVSEADPLSASKLNGDITHNLEKNDIVNEPVSILGSGYQQEKIEISPNQCLELKDDQVVEEEETPFTSIVNLEDDQVVEEEETSLTSIVNLKDVDETIPMEVDLENIEFQKVNGPIVDKDENKGVAAANATSSGDFEEGYPVVENGTANLEIQKVEKPHLGSSELLEASHKSYKEVLLHKNAEVSTALDTKGVKDEMKEPYVSDPENQEQLVESILPSSGNSTAIPPVSEHASKVQKPVSHDISSVSEKEVKPAGEILTSADSKITTTLLGLAPLPQRTQSNAGSRESGSRSAVDIPSTNNTSAPLSRQAAPLPESTTRVAQQPRVNGATASPPHDQLIEDQNGDAAEEYDETREKLQMIRVKFLRLAHRLGQTPHNVVVAQVLYRLGLAEQLRGRSGGRVGAFSFDRASAMAEQLEAAGQEPLDFTCTIMVLGKSGVGKSATINSIFDEVMFGTDAFQLGTKKVQDIVGTVQGIRVRVIDTPGLLPSWSDQHQNEKILNSVKRFIKKTPPDIVLYLDRLDMQGRDFGETPLLRTITEIFGPSIWFNAIVVLTHAASAPPEGPNGTATSYDMFVTQRSHVVQQAIRQAAGDMRLMNPVSLVENHSACRTNRAGQRVLPNGQVWKPHLLLLSFASKILAEANTLLKLQDSPPGRPFASRTRSPPLPFLLSTLLQSRPEVKLPSEQFGDDDDDAIDDDVDESSDSEEDENDYDNLPPFKSLTKAQLEKLPKSQRKAYYDELEYREKLFTKKQLKEEKRRRKIMKKMQEALKDLPTEYGENAEEESAGAASVPVPMPDLALPASFDSDNPTHRYRSLDSNPWLVRAVLEPNGWDHDIGYDGINVERLFVVKDKIPVSFSGHISKDKKDANLQMEIASSVKHGKGKATSLGFDMQSVGKEMTYTVRSESRFSNSRINKAAAGFSATLLGDVLTGGVKVEDKLLIGKRGQIVVSGGGIYGRGNVAYGGSVEATLRNRDDPLGRFLLTLAVSVMDWHGDLAIGCNSQTQIPLGRFSNLIARFNINNHGSGQVSLRINSSEQLQIVLFGLIPLVKKFLGNDKTG